jgi:hypothetical protein
MNQQSHQQTNTVLSHIYINMIKSQIQRKESASTQPIQFTY